MASIRGTVRKSDLEGGHYELVADDGTTYELEGSSAALKQDGARVEVDGVVDRGAMSIAMTGPRLKVKAVKRIK